MVCPGGPLFCIHRFHIRRPYPRSGARRSLFTTAPRKWRRLDSSRGGLLSPRRDGRNRGGARATARRPAAGGGLSCARWDGPAESPGPDHPRIAGRPRRPDGKLSEHLGAAFGPGYGASSDGGHAGHHRAVPAGGPAVHPDEPGQCHRRGARHDAGWFGRDRRLRRGAAGGQPPGGPEPVPAGGARRGDGTCRRRRLPRDGGTPAPGILPGLRAPGRRIQPTAWPGVPPRSLPARSPRGAPPRAAGAGAAWAVRAWPGRWPG